LIKAAKEGMGVIDLSKLDLDNLDFD